MRNNPVFRRLPYPFIWQLPSVLTYVPTPLPINVPLSLSVRRSRAGHQATIATRRAFAFKFNGANMDTGGKGNGKDKAASPGVNYT